ncbi:DNA-binding protein YbiB [Comamonas odontotermitis]|uniref:DNA-binding protein YbiB n=1 Tax=Comamonas odontotermitis TaxID=379895 RepID=UPI001CC5906E|nr:DNA-binding protein YbiB [Comamonas odontotermitis]UBB18235.1 DNA-binding protein YbiB [Comamonas odontotermitis]
MAIQHYIKEIGRGARGAKALDRTQTADLLGQILDGHVSDYEVGAFCIAMRIKGETAEEMCGLWDAVHARMARLGSPGPVPAVIIPSYNGARRLPTLTPLLALLLAREGLPVLVHGMQTEASRTSVFAVLQRLGISTLPQAGIVAPAQVTTVHTATLLPALARLLAVRQVIGLRNPGHSVAKLLQPVAGPALLLGSYTHPEYLPMLQATLTQLGLDALLSRGLEGEVCADPRRTPQYDGFVHGHHQLLQARAAGTDSEVPGLPDSIDADSTARYTEAVLAGRLPVPAALAQQVQHIRSLVDLMRNSALSSSEQAQNAIKSGAKLP